MACIMPIRTGSGELTPLSAANFLRRFNAPEVLVANRSVTGNTSPYITPSLPSPLPLCALLCFACMKWAGRVHRWVK